MRKHNSGKWVFFMATMIGFFVAAPHSFAAERFLGLTAEPPRYGFWEGETDYQYALRPRGTVRAVMLFARFPDTTVEETTDELYARLAPEGVNFFSRASYGKMTLRIDPMHRWIPMDHASTSPGYRTSAFESQKTYLNEVIRKASKSVDFRRYEVVYVVGSQAPGMPNSPTWIAPKGSGIVIQGREIRHGVTFGNDIRGDRWGWQTLAHETGHIFGLPDLYSYESLQPYKGVHKYVGCWDLMGFVAPGYEYLTWHKRKLGWLSDADFVVATTGSSEVLITPIHEESGKKAVVIPISATEAYVAEVREGSGLPEARKIGVLLYRVSLIARREGFIRVIPAAPDGNDPAIERRFVALYNALYTSGVVLGDEAAHARIEIIEQAGKAFRLRVTR